MSINPLMIPIVAIIGAFSIPIVAMITNAMKERYRAQSASISELERDEIARLNTLAEQMAERLETLEAILDHEVPDWRHEHDG